MGKGTFSLVREHHAPTPTIDSENIVGLRPHINPVAGNRLEAAEGLEFQVERNRVNLIEIRLARGERRRQVPVIQAKMKTVKIPIHKGRLPHLVRWYKRPEERRTRGNITYEAAFID